MKTLIQKSMLQFILCTIVILLLSTPLFYYLTKNFYAEEMVEAIHHTYADGSYHRIYKGWKKQKYTDESTVKSDSKKRSESKDKEYGEHDRNHQSIIPAMKDEMEEDIMTGLMIQLALIAAILGVSVTLMMLFITRRLWIPFDDTLKKIEKFTLGKDPLPQFMPTNIKEFDRLNRSITNLINRNISSYKVQKEFTENASHEMQTPIAVFRSKLDLLMQEDLNERELNIVQQLNDTTSRVSRLNRSLLLLAKIENNQYESKEKVDVAAFIQDNLPQYAQIYSEKIVFNSRKEHNSPVVANRPLLEALINNLVINALRHNIPNEPIRIDWESPLLIISNKAIGGCLDKANLFRRFHHTSGEKGNGLGLAIVKAICDYHRWTVDYTFSEGEHHFTVRF